MCWFSLWHSSSYSTSFTVLYFVSHLKIYLIFFCQVIWGTTIKFYQDAGHHSMHFNFNFNFNFNRFNLPLFQLVCALLPRHFLCYCLAALIQLQQWICFENILDNDNFKSAQTLVLHCCSISVRFFGICKKADLAFGFSGCPGRSLPLQWSVTIFNFRRLSND